MRNPALPRCALYELHRNDLNATIENHPSIRQALEESDQKRKAQQTQG